MAKRAGQGNHIFFSEAMAEREKSKLSLNNQLRDALRNNELVLHYQPSTGSTTAASPAWRRCCAGRRPMAPWCPGEFIPIAEETTLIQEIGYWVMKTACAQYSFWLNNGLVIPTCRSTSAPASSTAGFVQQVEYILRDTGVPRRACCWRSPSPWCWKTGWKASPGSASSRPWACSSPSTISAPATPHWPICAICPPMRSKLDRSFIQTLVHSEQDKAIVKAILDLARSFASP